jgi:hypothetical protein
LCQVRGHQRPHAIPHPGQHHAEAGVPHDVGPDIDGDEETKTQLSNQKRLGYGVQAFERKQKGHTPEHRLDLWYPIKGRNRGGAEPDAEPQDQSDQGRESECHLDVGSIQIPSLNEGGSNSEL